MLKLADDLKLPLDAATQTFAFIARKGAGKTYAAGKLVELLLAAGVQVVVLDTVGNWYGLRLGADGKSAGFDVPVLGGLRGDIPLEAAGGALIADIVVDTGRSMVLDASQFSLSDRKRFATAFGERLWLRKKGERHPAPLHLVIEESQLIVPQFTGTGGGDAARMLGVFEEIIRLGRNYGIGVSMITQRPQSVNKEVLNQTECLLVGQVNGAQERDALKKWITHQGMDVHLVDELPALKVGTFYVWSPQWLNLLQRVSILPKRTFDASATPKVGDKRVQRDLKPLDLQDLQQRLKATIEKAKADDPRELRKRIAALEQQLQRAPAAAAQAKTIEKPVITDAQLTRVDAAIERLNRILEKAAGMLTQPVSGLREQLATLTQAVKTVRQPAAPTAAAPEARTVRPAPPRALSVDNGAAGQPLKPVHRAMLTALAQHPDGLPKKKILAYTGYRSSGDTSAAFALLVREGWATAASVGLVITDSGREVLGPFEPLPVGAELRARVIQESNLSGLEKKILQALFAAHPQAITKGEILERTGYRSSGDTSAAFAHLVAIDYAVVAGTALLKAADVFFEEA